MDTTPPDIAKSRGQKFVAWLKKHWIALAIIVSALIATAVFLYLIQQKYSTQQTVDVATSAQPKKPERYFSLLTGKELGDAESKKLPVTAVMIENSPEARPQSGLKKAGVVYEAVAEGGITRFLALYQHNKPELIGPVRSLRLYYLEWASAYQASVAHVGGSYNALESVRSDSQRDLDQFFNPDTYWRSSDRYAPHNVYTSGAKLDELNQAKGYNESVFTSFKRADGKPSEEPNASTIYVNFSSALFNTGYAYHKESNTYLRSLGGEAHNDREEGQLAPDVLVVMKVETQSRGGTDGYQDLVTTGSGQAYVFQNGTVSEVTWRKDSANEPLQLLDGEGTPVTLNRGQTWIAAITSTGSVSWQ